MSELGGRLDGLAIAKGDASMSAGVGKSVGMAG